MQIIGNFLRQSEKMIFPEKVKRREYLETREAADKNAMAYFAQLPPLHKSPIITLDEAGMTKVQEYIIEDSSQLILIIPGFDSNGQSHKYNWLISDLNRRGFSVIRTNNEPHINLKNEKFDNYDHFTSVHQQKYLDFMKEYFARINTFLQEQRLSGSEKKLHIIASSAGGGAILALYELFNPIPDSMLILGPSGDIAFPLVEEGINNYLQSKSQKLFVTAGDRDHFRREEPFLTLKQKSVTTMNLSVSFIDHAEHDLKDDNRYIEVSHTEGNSTYFNETPLGGTIQLAIHREAFRALGLPVQELDALCEGFPYVKEFPKEVSFKES